MYPEAKKQKRNIFTAITRIPKWQTKIPSEKLYENEAVRQQCKAMFGLLAFP